MSLQNEIVGCEAQPEAGKEDTSVDVLMQKWIKDTNTSGDIKPNSDEEMSSDLNPENTAARNKEAPTCDFETSDVKVPLKDIWTRCRLCYRKIRETLEGGCIVKDKALQMEVRQDFENWLDIFLCNAITTEPCNDSWKQLEKQSISEDSNSSSLLNSIRRELVDLMMVELRNLCLHFEAYKDSTPLRDYLFGKGWRILIVLGKIECAESGKEKVEIEANLNAYESNHSSGYERQCAQYPKEFVDLLIHLFQVFIFVHSFGILGFLFICTELYVNLQC